MPTTVQAPDRERLAFPDLKLPANITISGLRFSVDLPLILSWMISSREFKITILGEGGDMGGLLHVKKAGWNGEGVVCPRSLFQTARSRDEFAKPAIYILMGPAENGEASTRIYVGECDSVRSRLGRHAREKKFWTTVVLFCAADETLNKAHCRYLEARLLKLARDSHRAELENDNKPAGAKLSKVDSGEADAFLEGMLLCLPFIGVHAFEPAKPFRSEGADEAGRQGKLFVEETRKRSKKERKNPRPERLKLRGDHIVAWALASDKGVLVQKGSRAVASTVLSAQPYVVALRKRLLDRGIFKVNGTEWELTEDHQFKSPTAAAAALLGRSTNGRIRWINESGKTLRELQQAAAGGTPKRYRWN